MSAPTILLVDDEPSVLRYTKSLLEHENYQVETAGSGEETLQRLQLEPAPTLIILDLVMPGMDGLETLENCKKIRPEQKVLMVSCSDDPGKIVQAIKLGASDYLNKPFQAPELRGTVRRVLDSLPANRTSSAQHGLKNGAVVEVIDDDLCFLAASPIMRQIHAQITRIARVDMPVLILGESGAGKEIVARLIHKMSMRAQRPMIKVNCAALPADLLESELFGYEAGAFTGATSSKPGQFELAETGTILLDEIGEMGVSLQAKLLHVLQDGEFSRLGGRSSILSNARVLAATNIDIQRALAEHKLREDLYYRLNAFTITVPPLRERREEIPLLLTHYMNSLASQFAKPPLKLSDRLLNECQRYHWPGNLRELGNFVKRYLILGDETIVADQLQVKNKENRIGRSQRAQYSSPARGLKALVRSIKDDAEAKEIRRVLRDTRWDRKLAAAQLRISCRALRYKIKRYGLLSPTDM
jgi:two-component system, NtrC family, response regulator AtoC